MLIRFFFFFVGPAVSFKNLVKDVILVKAGSHVRRKRKHSAIRKRNRVIQGGGRSRCIGVVVSSLSWSSSNET